jgi:NAD(P)-dependent dehydrogenase (short-subunit alcohol dehydrogenase family)
MKRLRAKRRIVAVVRGAVVVTGASTGIGEATTEHLRSLGFDVFAGVRKDEDAERARSNGLKAVNLDVTDPGSIESARGVVESALDGGHLAGLVNNAGVAISGPIEFVSPGELTRQLDINVVGQVRVTQAFMKLLRRDRGRVINISSIGGRIALPLVGPYAASKFALEAVSDSLRREVRSQGIEVVVVEPGAIKTPIWGKGNAAADAMLADAPAEAEELYGDMIRALRAETVKIEEDRGLPPEEVAKVVGEALTARKPKTRYLVGRDAKMRAAMAKRLPDRVMDSLIGRALSG